MSEWKPEYDKRFAEEELLGSYVLVGLLYTERKGERIVSQEQKHGKVIAVDEKVGITLENPQGGYHRFPPCTNVFQRAEPGSYELAGTGVFVDNPDFLASWTIYR